MNIPDARQASDQASAGDTHAALIKVVIDSIGTSVGVKTKTATFSIAGKQGPDVMQVICELKRKGYKLSQIGTDVTVSF